MRCGDFLVYTVAKYISNNIFFLFFTYNCTYILKKYICFSFVNHLQKNIEPYVPSKLLDVNFAKRTLFQFCKVLVEISGIMADTKLVMQRMDENKSKHMQTILELKKEITKITDVVVQQWSQPILVCTSIPSCAEVYKVSCVGQACRGKGTTKRPYFLTPRPF